MRSLAGGRAICGDRLGHAVTSDEFYARCTVAGAALFLALELDYFAIAKTLSWWRPSIDAFGYAIGRDLLNTWMGGKSAFSGGRRGSI